MVANAPDNPRSELGRDLDTLKRAGFREVVGQSAGEWTVVVVER